jgi:uncharacterized protein
VKIQILTILIVIGSISSVSAASFDCKRASTEIEKAICANPEMSALDEKMASSYQHLIKACNDSSNTIKANQIKWLKNTAENCATEVGCLKAQYSYRIKYLHEMSNQCEAKPSTVQETSTLDCKNTRNENEKAICSNQKALALYQQMVTAYKTALTACNDDTVVIENPQQTLLENASRYLVGNHYIDPIKELKPYFGLEYLNEITSYCQGTPKESRTKNLKITNASKQHDFVIQLQNYCIPSGDSYTCSSAGLLQVLKKGTAVVLQKIPLETIFLSFEKQKLLVNSAALYDYQGAINVGDFNFDGQEDFAVQNGNNGSYQGPSYDVFLFGKGKFQYSKELSDLIEGSLGFFRFDTKHKLLTTFSKSGCCYHETTQYKVVRNKPVAVVRFVDDALADDGQGSVTEEHFVNGKWKVKSKERYRPEEYCEEKIDQAARSLGHYVGTSATRVCKLLPTNKQLGIVSLRYPRDGKNWQSYDLGVDVFLAEVETGNVLAQYSNPDEFKNAHNMEQFIDTAPYQLTKNIRAFGVRSHFNNISKGVGYQLMTLYVVNGNKLSPVLKNLVTGLRNAELGINRTLQMAPSSGNSGYADIIVNETSYHKKQVENAKATNEAVKPQTKSYHLVYNGRQYVLPAALVALP